MPTITNFGDVVTTGNTLLQGNLTVLNTSTTITGNLLPNVSGTANIGNFNFQFGSAYVQTVNVASLNVTTQANISTMNIVTSAFFTNVSVSGNLTSANITSTGNIWAGSNVNGTNLSMSGNISGANLTSTGNIWAGSNVNSVNLSATGNIWGGNLTSQTNVWAGSNVNATNLYTTGNVWAANLTSSGNVWAGSNVNSVNVSATGNVWTANLTSAGNVWAGSNVNSTNLYSTGNVTSGNLTSTGNIWAGSNVNSTNVSVTGNVTSGNLTSTGNIWAGSNVNSTNVSATGNISAGSNVNSTNVYSTGNVWGQNLTSQYNVWAGSNVNATNVYATGNVSTGNLYASNIIMSSNMSTNTGFGNVYLTGNLVVNGNIFSSGGSVGSGSGTSQGILYTYAASNTLPAAFATGTAGPSIAGYHINFAGFTPEAAQAVTQFSGNSGLLKFTTTGLYQVTCVFTGDQPVVKVAVGKTTAYTTFSALQASPVVATSGYDYVYNYPTGASPSHVVTLPITVTDVTQYYYLDVFFSTVAGSPTTLYATRSTTAAGSAYGTYVQVAPFGNYLTSATGVAAALLANCVGSSNLSGVYSSNAYRLTLTSANGWTVNGTSTSLAVTSNGNFQVNQAGIYEVNLCLNTTGNTPVQFQVGSVADDTKVPNSTTPSYLYSYAPMYTQDPTTVVSLPLNITNVSNVYFVECSFPGTVTGNVALSNVSTFVSIKPIGGYISTATNPWVQQGTSVYYNDGAVGIGGAVPTSLTETLTVNGNTSFVGNVTQVTDASSNTYVVAKRVPAGSLSVANYVTGSVPLTTTTNLIQNYLSNAATIRANTATGSITQALYCPGTANSGVNIQNSGSSVALANLATSNLFIEAWVNTSQLGGNQVIIERATLSPTFDFYFYITSANQLNFTIYRTDGGTGSASNATTVSAGTWYYVAASYQSTGLTTGTLRVFTNGGLGGTTGSITTAQPRLTPSANVYVGYDPPGSNFYGNVADVRVWSGGIVPTATFASPAAAPFGSTQPAYITGTPTLLMSLNSQYFPGASTSPYGPCLTLPGTVGSYYSAANTAYDTNWRTSGFCLEMWINYASFANATNGGTTQSGPLTFSHGPGGGTYDWGFGAHNGGGLVLFNGGPSGANTANSVMTTGTWNHIMVQGNGSNIYMAVNGTFQALNAFGYSPAGGNNTIAPTQPSVLAITASNPIYIGSSPTLSCPNFAVAKARLTFGTSGSPSLGNVYSSGNFTPNPNFASVPAGATVAWQLDSQFPLPTYPSIQDVTQLPLQSSSFGTVPVPVGGVTSNIAGPLTAYPQLDSLRFDGTGYIDYGNAASSALTTNLWANAWTIEAWVYPTNVSNAPTILQRTAASTYTYDWSFWLNSNQISFVSTPILGGGTATYNTGSASYPVALNTWSHVAATSDGTRSNVYVNGQLANTIPISAMAQGFNPQLSTQVGTGGFGAVYNFYGNLADLRVSNVARYTGSSFTVPTAQMPFVNDSNTLLLLKTLGGQVGTTLEVQGRGLGAVSLGATRTVQAYPPAPMSSYLLDTTGNTAVTYGQGKYVASASSENGANVVWRVFDKSASTAWFSGGSYDASGVYSGSVTTVDTLGNSYPGEWLQIQLPISLLLSTYGVNASGAGVYTPLKWWILGSRDGINWTQVHQVVGQNQNFNLTFTPTTSQAYNYYRMVINITGTTAVPAVYEWTLNGTEESLCVTSDSKVGVGIANPQRALEVAGDLVVGGTISGGAGMGSFRNRIINGDMRIAQRGTSNVLVTATASYLIDRFFVNATFSAGTITQYQSALAVSDAPYQLGFRNYMNVYVSSAVTSTIMIPGQNFEGYTIQDLNWGTSFGSPVTLSFWFRTNAPTGSQFTYSFLVAPYSYVGTFVPIQGVWQYWSFSVPPPPNGTSVPTGSSSALGVYIAPYYPAGATSTVNAWNTGSYTYFAQGSYNWPSLAGNYIHFTGVQLEKGTVATPWEQRPYATELALCQRYWEQTYSIGTAPGTVVYAGQGNFYVSSDAGSNLLFTQRYMVPKRAGVAPTFYNATTGAAGTWTYARSGASGTASVTTDRYNEFGFNSYVNIGAAYVVGSTVGHWVANAEL